MDELDIPDSEDVIRWEGKTYHQFDHAFVMPSGDGRGVYDIVQIIKIRAARDERVLVRRYGRHSQIADVDCKESVGLGEPRYSNY